MLNKSSTSGVTKCVRFYSENLVPLFLASRGSESQNKGMRLGPVVLFDSSTGFLILSDFRSSTKGDHNRNSDFHAFSHCK